MLSGETSKPSKMYLLQWQKIELKHILSGSSLPILDSTDLHFLFPSLYPYFRSFKCMPCFLSFILTSPFLHSHSWILLSFLSPRETLESSRIASNLLFSFEQVFSIYYIFPYNIFPLTCFILLKWCRNIHSMTRIFIS